MMGEVHDVIQRNFRSQRRDNFTWSLCVVLPSGWERSPGNHSSRWLPKSNLLGWNLTLSETPRELPGRKLNQEPGNAQDSWCRKQLSSLRNKYHGKPAVLWAKLVSREESWRVTSLLENKETPGVIQPGKPHLPAFHCLVPPGANTSFCVYYF